MKRIILLFVFASVLVSCAKDADDEVETLQTYINTQVFEEGAVIACAASEESTGDIWTFYYPEPGATNIRFYETTGIDLDESNFTNYIQVFLESEPFFNGYLGRFTQTSPIEKWIIITFELDAEIKISNPIRSKQLSKPTVWNDEVVIDQSEIGMPKFKWLDNPVGDNAIYFQVISNSNNDFLSGTYTYENEFQYYKTDNVVLNVTQNTPPALISNNSYNFTLMDVSEDNWVNWVVLKSFVAE